MDALFVVHASEDRMAVRGSRTTKCVSIFRRRSLALAVALALALAPVYDLSIDRSLHVTFILALQGLAGRSMT